MTIPAKPRPISDVDVPLSRLESDIKQLVARQRFQAGIAAEARHVMDPAEAAIETAFIQLAAEHPEACAVPKMTVRVCDRGEGRSYVGVTIRTVTVPATCPQCGGPRGADTVNAWRFCEDGEWYTVDRWTNPCGHVDMYAAVLREARAITEGGAA
ncbi:hypothetical protein [Streptomyces sp. NPDC057413]|uniref:hypothetical protein n=1 Tax=Streptomyces sp. NPDC057413 TaxID=3346124 RepID=UPI0036BC54BC